MIRRLEGMLEADMANLFEGKAIRPPAEWPEAERQAITRLNVNEQSGAWSFNFIDKSRVSEQLSRLTGLYKNEEEVDNPLETALSRIPRDELIAIRDALQMLSEIDGDLDRESI